MNVKIIIALAMKSVKPKGGQDPGKAPTRVSQRIPSAKKIHPDEVRGPWWNDLQKQRLARLAASKKRVLKLKAAPSRAKTTERLEGNGGCRESPVLSKKDEDEEKVASKEQENKIVTPCLSRRHEANDEAGSNIITPEVIRIDSVENAGDQSPRKDNLKTTEVASTPVLSASQVNQ